MAIANVLIYRELDVPQSQKRANAGADSSTSSKDLATK
jgi:hypothetical protein